MWFLDDVHNAKLKLVQFNTEAANAIKLLQSSTMQSKACLGNFSA